MDVLERNGWNLIVVEVLMYDPWICIIGRNLIYTFNLNNTDH